jgi:hypothetical protein
LGKALIDFIPMVSKILLILIGIAAIVGIVSFFLRSKTSSPETSWKVVEQNGSIFCTYPDGSQHSVAWSDLKSIQMETNDRGPMEPDVFWILRDSKSSCRFPTGAAGERDLHDKLFNLPNFNLKLFMEEAATSTQNRIFDLWIAK